MDSLTDWISAVTTAGALGAAVWAGVTSRRLVYVELERDSRIHQRDLREQAAQVSAWTVTLPSLPAKLADCEGHGILVRNSSSSPVHSLVVRSTDWRNDTQPAASMLILPPGEYVIVRSQKQYGWEYPKQLNEVGGVARPVTKGKNWAVSELQFVDSYGVGWQRSGSALRCVDTGSQ